MIRVITQKFIFRSDLQSNPAVLYLFGDNLLRIGLGGQAKEMRGEPNAVGIATKKAPGMHRSDFFSDEDYWEFRNTLDADIRIVFEHLGGEGLVVIPADGLGTGLSQLPERAPKCNAYLVQCLQEITDRGNNL